MNPTWSRLSLASSSGPASTVERPPMRTVPPVGVRMHPRIDNSVVLPLPDGPINSVNTDAAIRILPLADDYPDDQAGRSQDEHQRLELRERLGIVTVNVRYPDQGNLGKA